MLRIDGSMGTLLALLGLVACSSSEPPPAPAPKRAPTPVVRRAEGGELMIRRTACYGECPAYTAFVSTDGRVFYHGRHFAEHEGLRTGTVEPDDVQELLGLALDNGYFDAPHDHEDGRTDQATVFTSVVADDAHQWTRNYGRAAPPEIAMVETGIDALLERTRWDAAATPVREASARSCERLGTTILARCEDELQMKVRGTDCPFWLEAWEALEVTTPDPATAQRCARLDLSLDRVGRRPGEAVPEVPMGPKCKAWLENSMEGCRRVLSGAGERFDSCVATMRQMEHVFATLHYDDREIGRTASEFHCGRFDR